MGFYKGEQVAIKSWKEMAEEFELFDNGSIFIPKDLSWFTREMMPYCDRKLTIKEPPCEYHEGYTFEEDDIKDYDYCFTESMLKSLDNREYEVASDEEMRMFLG